MLQINLVNRLKEKVIDIDAKMPFRELNSKTYNELIKLSPFGSMNTNPVFITKNLQVVECKTLSNNKHIKLKLSDGEKSWVPANGWRKGHLASKLSVGTKIDVVYTLDIDTWMGANKLTMIIEDISVVS